MAQAVAAELRAELARRQMSGRQLAHHLRMPPANVTRWLSADTPITLDGLHRICTSLGLTMAELIGRAEAAPAPVVTVSGEADSGHATGR